MFGAHFFGEYEKLKTLQNQYSLFLIITVQFLILSPIIYLALWVYSFNVRYWL